MTTTRTHPAIPTTVRPYEPADHDGAADVITAAFFDDPVTDWLIPDRERRTEVLPPLFRLYVDWFAPHGETYVTADGAGAALWLPPGRELLSGDAAETYVADIEAAAGNDAPRMFALDDFFEQHAPAVPHWHLQLLAVHPDQQGRGLGSALLDAVLPVADSRREHAYLEATTLRSRALYERHGFVCTGTITIPDGPPLWQMLREPRTHGGC